MGVDLTTVRDDAKRVVAHVLDTCRPGSEEHADLSGLLARLRDGRVVFSPHDLGDRTGRLLALRTAALGVLEATVGDEADLVDRPAVMAASKAAHEALLR